MVHKPLYISPIPSCTTPPIPTIDVSEVALRRVYKESREKWAYSGNKKCRTTTYVKSKKLHNFEVDPHTTQPSPLPTLLWVNYLSILTTRSYLIEKTCNAYVREDKSPQKFQLMCDRDLKSPRKLYYERKRENKSPRKLEFQESAKSAKFNPREN